MSQPRIAVIAAGLILLCSSAVAVVRLQGDRTGASNVLAAQNGGLVTASEIAETVTNCGPPGSPTPEVSRCVSEALMSEGRAREDVVAALYQWNQQYPDLGTLCHSVAHMLGRAWGKVYDPLQLVLLDGGRCDGGLMHGTVEGLAFLADEARFTELITKVCRPLPSGSRLRHDCAHGVGHALTIRKPAPFHEMVNYCAILAEEDQSACYTAVLMVYSTDSASLAEDVRVPVPRLDTDEVDEVCLKMPANLVTNCWLGIWQLYPLESIETLLSWLQDACSVAARVGMETKCAESMGAMLMMSHSRVGGDSPSVAEQARTAFGRCPDGSRQDPCTRGVVQSAVSWWFALHGDLNEFVSPCPALPPARASVCKEAEGAAFKSVV